MVKVPKAAVVRKRKPKGEGRDPTTSIRLPPALTKAIDAWASAAGIGRSSAIRRWIDEGLKRRPKA
jgi:hypothetical protein